MGSRQQHHLPTCSPGVEDIPRCGGHPHDRLLLEQLGREEGQSACRGRKRQAWEPLALWTEEGRRAKETEKEHQASRRKVRDEIKHLEKEEGTSRVRGQWSSGDWTQPLL